MSWQVALNEQFMVALLPANVSNKGKDGAGGRPQYENRVVSVLMCRLGSSRTFGENLIFMLNRAGKCLGLCSRKSGMLRWNFRAFT